MTVELDEERGAQVGRDAGLNAVTAFRFCLSLAHCCCDSYSDAGPAGEGAALFSAMFQWRDDRAFWEERRR